MSRSNYGGRKGFLIIQVITLAHLKNTLYNVTHHVPPFFGYCHWFDVEQVVAWPKDSFLQNITGLLEYDR